MTDSVRDSGERPIDRVRQPMTTRERYDLRRPCGELMADVPWDGLEADAKTMSARQFLGTLLG